MLIETFDQGKKASGTGDGAGGADSTTAMTHEMRSTLGQFGEIVAETSRAGIALPVLELQRNL